MTRTHEQRFQEAKKKYNENLRHLHNQCLQDIFNCEDLLKHPSIIKGYNREWLRIVHSVPQSEPVILDKDAFMNKVNESLTAMEQQSRMIEDQHWERLHTFYKNQYAKLPWWYRLFVSCESFCGALLPCGKVVKIPIRITAGYQPTDTINTANPPIVK